MLMLLSHPPQLVDVLCAGSAIGHSFEQLNQFLLLRSDEVGFTVLLSNETLLSLS